MSRPKIETRKRTKLAIGILILILVLLIISWATHLIQNLFSTSRNYVWSGEFNINLLIKRGQSYGLFSYNPKEQKLTIINIPENTFMNVPRGFGLWQLRAVYGLGGSRNSMGGDTLLADTLTSFFAIPIDGFLDFSAALNQSPAEIVNTLRNNPLSGINLLSGLKTNLTMWELLRLKLRIIGTRFDKISDLDLAKLDVTDQETLPDGTLVLTADPVRLDSMIMNLLSDPVIISERKSIAVLNATDHPQLAGKAARLIANLGGNVIITANAQKKLKQTQVAGQESLTLKRLRQIFDLGCQNNPKCDKISPLDEDLVYQRGEISVLLGEDFFDR